MITRPTFKNHIINILKKILKKQGLDSFSRKSITKHIDFTEKDSEYYNANKEKLKNSNFFIKLAEKILNSSPSPPKKKTATKKKTVKKKKKTAKVTFSLTPTKKKTEKKPKTKTVRTRKKHIKRQERSKKQIQIQNTNLERFKKAANKELKEVQDLIKDASENNINSEKLKELYKWEQGIIEELEYYADNDIQISKTKITELQENLNKLTSNDRETYLGTLTKEYKKICNQFWDPSKNMYSAQDIIYHQYNNNKQELKKIIKLIENCTEKRINTHKRMEDFTDPDHLNVQIHLLKLAQKISGHIQPEYIKDKKTKNEKKNKQYRPIDSPIGWKATPTLSDSPIFPSDYGEDIEYVEITKKKWKKKGGSKYHDALSISENASPNTIKKKYKELAKIYHPDRNTGNEEKFKKINRAKQVLLGEATGTPDVNFVKKMEKIRKNNRKNFEKFKKLKKEIKKEINNNKKCMKKTVKIIKKSNKYKNLDLKKKYKLKKNELCSKLSQKHEKINPCMKKTVKIIKKSKKYENLKLKGKYKLNKKELCKKLYQ